MNTAIRLISRRNHTEQEIRQKLRQRGFEAEVIVRVISECQRFNYINDKETARKYLGELRSKGQGIRGIRFSMKKKESIMRSLTRFLMKIIPRQRNWSPRPRHFKRNLSH